MAENKTPIVVNGAENDAMIQLWGVIAHISGLPVSAAVSETREAIHDLVRVVRSAPHPLPPQGAHMTDARTPALCSCGTTLVCPDIGCDRNKWEPLPPDTSLPDPSKAGSVQP